MTNRLLPIALMLGLGSAPSALALALADGRSAAEILREVDETRPPAEPKDLDTDREVQKVYLGRVRDYESALSALAIELYRADPRNDRLPTLMTTRWVNSMRRDRLPTASKREVAEVLEAGPPDALRVSALAVLAVDELASIRGRIDPPTPALDAFLAAAPKGDERAMEILRAASKVVGDDDRRAKYEDRIVADWPESPAAASIVSARRRKSAVGRPFELSFDEATTGRPIRMADLKGKVVVVDFWATWCGPCVAELPRLKALYAAYRAKGVEFVGVSLDEPKEAGGLDALRSFVKDREVPWPQYYQGDGWSSPFSAGWGVDAIPALFVVDADGNLAALDARDDLEALIVKLIARRDGAAKDED